VATAKAQQAHLSIRPPGGEWVPIEGILSMQLDQALLDHPRYRVRYVVNRRQCEDQMVSWRT
jgi:hypothetical protein